MHSFCMATTTSSAQGPVIDARSSSSTPTPHGCRVDHIVYRVDPAAEQTAESRMGPTPDVGDDSS
jgi:hypothetical protein